MVGKPCVYVTLVALSIAGCRGQLSTGGDISPSSPEGDWRLPTAAAASTAHDLLQRAASAHWHNNDGQVPWNTGLGDSRGSCTTISTQLEDGSSARVLFTHPRWVKDGFMHGAFDVTIPAASLAPKLSATFGFMNGAERSDGVTFSVTTNSGGHWRTLLRARKPYNGALQSVTVDLAPWAGQSLTLFLNADAGHSPGYDWALWSEARITVQNRKPYGYVDAVDMTTHTVNGWAKDDDSPSEPLDVHFYVDGVFRGAATADQHRSDLGGSYGFRWSIPAAYRTGEHVLRVHALDPDGGDNPQLGYSPSRYNYDTGLVLGPITRLYGDGQMPFFMDATMATMKVPNDPHRLYFFHTAGDNTFKYKGTLQNPFEQLIWNKTQAQYIDKRGLLQGYACVRLWTQSIYRHSDSLWLSFSHIEKFPASCGLYDGNDQYSVGLSVSTNQGESWTFCGEIVKPQLSKSNTNNVGGLPVLVIAGYFHVYFNEHGPGVHRHSVARAPVSDVINAAASYGVVPWRKFDGNSWTQDGLTGLGAHINTADAHTDAVHCPSSGRYLLLDPRVDGTLALRQSTNGISWSELALIDDRARSDTWTFYPTFVSTFADATADNLQVGSSFHVIWPRKSGSDYQHDDLYSRRVSFAR